MNNFYIGQDIVAIVDHSQGCFKKNDAFVALDISFTKCCNKPMVDVGIREKLEPNVEYYTECRCGSQLNDQNAICWFYSSCFAPLDDLVNIEELSEVLEFELIT